MLACLLPLAPHIHLHKSTGCRVGLPARQRARSYARERDQACKQFCTKPYSGAGCASICLFVTLWRGERLYVYGSLAHASRLYLHCLNIRYNNAIPRRFLISFMRGLDQCANIPTRAANEQLLLCQEARRVVKGVYAYAERDVRKCICARVWEVVCTA